MTAVAAAVELKANLKQIRRQEKAKSKEQAKSDHAAGHATVSAAADARVVCTDGGKTQRVLFLSHSGVQLKIKRGHYAKLRELYRVSHWLLGGGCQGGWLSG